MDKSIHTQEYATLLSLLRETREAAGMTQTDLAHKLNMTQSFVSKWERGEARLDVIQLRTVCRILGTDFQAFVRHLEQRLVKRRR